MKTKLEFTLPACWASYLINGDASGMPDEDKAQCDAFLKGKGLPAPVSCSDESWFSWRNDATKLGGDVMDFFFLVEDKALPSELRTARERGANTGLLDAQRHGKDIPNFERTENPYGVETEAELYEAFERGYENTFEASKGKL